MASKDNVAYKSRFDFSDAKTDDWETGSLKELLAEINCENKNQKTYSENVPSVNIDTLDTIRNGIKTITGATFEKRLNTKIPLKDLKTIKLLYRVDTKYSAQLIRLITSPQLKGRPSLDYRDEDPIVGYDKPTRIITELRSELSKEISNERLAQINNGIPTIKEKLLTLMDLDAEVAIQQMHRHHGDLLAISRNYRLFKDAIVKYTVHDEPGMSPLHEAMYTNLRTLLYSHHAIGMEGAIQEASIDRPIQPVVTEMDQLCHDLVEGSHRPFRHVTTLMAFPGFVKEHIKQFIDIVNKATNIPIAPRDFERIINRAQIVLYITAINWIKNDPFQFKLSTVDCVAALCTVWRESKAKQKAKKKAKKKTKGKITIYSQVKGADVPKTLFGLLTKKYTIERIYKKDHIPHTIKHVIFNRWLNMRYAIVGCLDYHKDHTAYQTEKLKKYAKCLGSNDIDVIKESLNEYINYVYSIPLKDPFHPSFLEQINQWLADGVE